LVEETHYYPFGLIQAGISSKAASFGNPENKKKYNGIEFENDLDLSVYDANFRELDPQTGRWWQIDPKIENMEAWSPYASNYDNPITFSDPLGDEPDGGCCGELLDKIYDGAVNVARTFNTYVNPIASVVELATGKSTESDFTEAKPRAVSGAEAAISLIPGGKIEGALFKAGEKILDKAAILQVNKTVGKEGEKIVTQSLEKEFGKGHTVVSQVTGKLENGGKKVYDNVVINDKTGKAVLTNETKTGGARLSGNQARAKAGENVTLTGKKLPENVRGQTISSSTTPYRTSRVNTKTGNITNE
jgi:RHS repeat-associated protein